MKRINWKGVNAEAAAGIFTLLLALVNASLQMMGCNVLPIGNEEITDITSIVFLIVTALWNLWKNRNLTTASQKAQEVTNAIKNGELLIDEVDELLDKFKKQKKGANHME